MTRSPGTGVLDVVQPRIPRQSAGEQDDRRPDGVDPDDRFTAELASAVSGARRRAVRDGDRHVDTAHLLHSLLETDADVRAVLGDGPRIARLLGYLVQRSIGYGLRWQSAVEDSGTVPVVSGATGFSPLAAAAVDEACARAVRRGDDRARGVDLLAALVADPQARAVEVLARAAVEPRAVTAGVARYFEPAS